MQRPNSFVNIPPQFMHKTICMLGLALMLGVGEASAAPPEAAISKPGRLEADLQRDARSKPQAVLKLLDLKPGDRVVDIFGGGGYYSELLSTVVEEDGEVLLHNNAAYRKFVGKSLEQRFRNRVIGKVSMLDREVDDLGLGEGQLDAALIIMSYHDLYHTAVDWPAINSRDFLGQILRGLKPGGRFLIVDHAAAQGSGKSSAQKLHRIEESFAIDDITANGFEFVSSSNDLRNPDDDYSKSVFDPAVMGKTDRFTLLFKKPGA